MTQHVALAHPLLDVFLLGFVTACSGVATLFFVRFWRTSRDPLFLAFAVFFFLQGLRETSVLNVPHPNEGSLWFFMIRAVSVAVVLAAVVWKNFAR